LIYNSSHIPLKDITDNINYNPFRKLSWSYFGQFLAFGVAENTLGYTRLKVWSKGVNSIRTYYQYSSDTANRILAIDWSPDDKFIAFHIQGTKTLVVNA